MKKAIITVVGKDTVGILARTCTYLAEANVNILDISQTVVQDYFNMMMVVDISGSKLPFAELAACLREPGGPVARLVVKHEFLADVSVKVALSSYHRGRIADPAAVRGLAGHYFVRFMAVDSGAGLLEIPLISKRDNISQY